MKSSSRRSGYRTIPEDRTWKVKSTSVRSSRQKILARSSLRNSENSKNASAQKQKDLNNPEPRRPCNPRLKTKADLDLNTAIRFANHLMYSQLRTRLGK